MVTVIEEDTREALCVSAKPGMGHAEVLEALYPLFLKHGKPEYLRSDNGSEFIARDLLAWLKKMGIKPVQIYPGSPWENGFAESFFSRLRDELLNVEEFMNLAEAKWFANRRIYEHNEERPHSSLGYQTPSEFASQCAAGVRA